MSLVEQLSDEALALNAGWFSFGKKATVTIAAPYANYKANLGAIDELIGADIITYEWDDWQKTHVLRGTEMCNEIRQSDRSKKLIMSYLLQSNTLEQ